jgi:hypothetical protein
MDFGNMEGCRVCVSQRNDSTTIGRTQTRLPVSMRSPRNGRLHAPTVFALAMIDYCGFRGSNRIY